MGDDHGLSNCKDCIISGVGSQKIRIWDVSEMVRVYDVVTGHDVLLCAYHAGLRKFKQEREK